MARLSARQVHEADTRLIADAAKIRFFPLVVDRGEGCRIIDPDGRRYLDFTAAWALANTGYARPRSTREWILSGKHWPMWRPVGSATSRSRPSRLVELYPRGPTPGAHRGGMS